MFDSLSVHLCCLLFVPGKLDGFTLFVTYINLHIGAVALFVELPPVEASNEPMALITDAQHLAEHSEKLGRFGPGQLEPHRARDCLATYLPKPAE